MFVQWSESLPTDSYCEGPLVPVSSVDYRHLSVHVGAGSVENLVGVAML